LVIDEEEGILQKPIKSDHKYLLTATTPAATVVLAAKLEYIPCLFMPFQNA
jgi:hypothetical protein